MPDHTQLKLHDASVITCNCDALRDLLPFILFKKREKHSWRRVTVSKITG